MRDWKRERNEALAERDFLQAELDRIKELSWQRTVETDAIHDVLVRIAQVQPKVLAMIRREGFKFETPLQESSGWEKLAFTLYSTICEIDVFARSALPRDEDGAA